jgi:hypothetical protein
MFLVYNQLKSSYSVSSAISTAFYSILKVEIVTNSPKTSSPQMAVFIPSFRNSVLYAKKLFSTISEEKTGADEVLKVAVWVVLLLGYWVCFG